MQEYFREGAATPRGGMTPRAGTPRAGTPRRQQHVEASPAIPLYSYNPPYIGASQHSSYADDPYQDAVVRGRDPNGMVTSHFHFPPMMPWHTKHSSFRLTSQAPSPPPGEERRWVPNMTISEGRAIYSALRVGDLARILQRCAHTH